MQGVGERSAKQGIVAVGLSGSLGRDAAQIYSHGIESLITSVDSPMQIEEAISRAEELYYLAAIRMFRFIRAGMKIAQKQ
jgi:glycerate kinase